VKHEEEGAPVTLPVQASATACQTVRGGLTDEEVEVLSALREVREQIRALRLELATAATMRRHEIGAVLDRLTAEGRRLTGERDAARHRRMVLLGHEEP
jgi:hypothetical protein